MDSIRLLPLCVLLALATFAGLAAWVSRSADLVTTRFFTVQEARANGAFERGWLPPVLPDSARNITETNNLDLNTGDGSFEFDAADYQTLVSRVTPASPEVRRRYSEDATFEGFSVFMLSNDVTIWTLAIRPKGVGFYTVDSRR